MDNNMQLRDWFAGMAMQGLLAGKQMGSDDAALAEKAYQIAAAMLEKSVAVGGTTAPTPDEPIEIEGIMGTPRR